MSEFIEKFTPLILTCLVGVTLVYFRIDISMAVESQSIDFSVLYAAVFDWSAIQTGFLFGIFGFIAGKNDGFIAEIRSTPQMALFSRYQSTAIYLGFALTFSSIPMMVTGFKYGTNDIRGFAIFVGWSCLATWAFFAFLRVAYVFGILIRVKDQRRLKG